MEEIRVKTKPDELCAQLTAMARRLGPGAKLSSGRALSNSYGVSRTTLQLALSRLEAENVIFRRKGSGVYVSDAVGLSPVQRNVALICNFGFVGSAGHLAFWDQLIHQVRQRADHGGEACQLHLTSPVAQGVATLQESFMTEVREGRVHGALAVGLDKPAAEWIVEQKLPLVSFACWSPWMVGFDETELIRLGVRQLKERGCRRIGLWVPVAPAYAGPTRFSQALRLEFSFRAALETEKLQFESRLVRCGAAPSHQLELVLEASQQEQGYETAKEVFAGPKQEWPDGVLCTNDNMTHGALAALRKLGVQAGTDVQIASHANRGSSVLMGQNDDLTLIEFDPRALVQTMFSVLETQMSGGTPTVEKVWLQPHVRQHVG